LDRSKFLDQRIALGSSSCRHVLARLQRPRHRGAATDARKYEQSHAEE